MNIFVSIFSRVSSFSDLIWFVLSNFQNRGVDDDDHDSRQITDLDPVAYITKNGFKEGEDPYARNAYNLKVSDKVTFDREVPEVRDQE